MAADGNEASAAGRAAALLGRPVGGAAATPSDLRSAAGLLHDLVVWGLDRGLPDSASWPPSCCPSTPDWPGFSTGGWRRSSACRRSSCGTPPPPPGERRSPRS